MKTIEQEINEATARWGVKHDAIKCGSCSGSGLRVHSRGYNDDLGVVLDICEDCRGKGYIIMEVAA
jgi:DnaJ-class molecular chaperone